jgi:RHS repeat-associated protein
MFSRHKTSQTQGFSTEMAYRFTFNGQETDNELDNGTLAFEYRIYDPRLGRFLSVDPLRKNFPWWGSYVFAGNMCIEHKELEGRQVDGNENETESNGEAANVIWSCGMIWNNETREFEYTIFYQGGGGLSFPTSFTPNEESGYEMARRLDEEEAKKREEENNGKLPSIPNPGGARTLPVRNVITGSSGKEYVINRMGPVPNAEEILIDANVTQVKVTQGTSERVILIGQNQDARVIPVAQATNAETFKASDAATDQWKNLKEQYNGQQIPEETVKQTMMYRENQDWIQKAKEQGATVIDIGTDPTAPGTSTFYEMEKTTIYGSSTPTTTGNDQNNSTVSAPH